jgi:hypothetical protein
LHDTYPVYFFASSSPFVKCSIRFNDNDRRIVQYLVDFPLDERFHVDSIHVDTIEQLEKSHQKSR